MKQEKETLTKGEFDVMSKLWDINHSASTRDIMERFGESKPAYSTIATYMKKLVDKGFIDYYKVKGGGKTKRYVAKVQRAEYTRRVMNSVKRHFFRNNALSMVSFFVKEEHLTADEIQELLAMIER